MLVIRELTEDLTPHRTRKIARRGTEHQGVTEAALPGFFRFAFDGPARRGRKTLHGQLKPTTSRLADGLSWRPYETAARDYPELAGPGDNRR